MVVKGVWRLQNRLGFTTVKYLLLRSVRAEEEEEEEETRFVVPSKPEVLPVLKSILLPSNHDKIMGKVKCPARVSGSGEFLGTQPQHRDNHFDLGPIRRHFWTLRPAKVVE